MDVYAKIFAVVSLCCLIAALICFFKYRHSEKCICVGCVLLVVFLYSMVSAVCFANTNRCVECRAVVNTAFCTQCGLQNDNYVEIEPKNVTGLMCPVCKIECHTPHCGDCGSEIVFVEND